MTGKPKPDPTGRFHRDDVRIIELRLEGRSTSDIADEIGWTSSTITSRLKYYGLPTGHSYRFLHGEVVSNKHFRDFCGDFGVNRETITKEIGKDLSYLRPTDIFTTKRADIILALRNRWVAHFCFRTFGKKRVREFLASELRHLPWLKATVIEPLRALRGWLRAQNGSAQQRDILGWICKQSHEEVVAWEGADDTRLRFRVLIFLWLALKKLRERRPHLLEGTQTVHKVANELLSTEFGVVPRRMDQAAAGQLTPLDPRTLGERIRGELWMAKSAQQKRSRKPEAEREYVQVGRKVEEMIPIFENLFLEKRGCKNRRRRNSCSLIRASRCAKLRLLFHHKM
jgi:hypothetical protein